MEYIQLKERTGLKRFGIKTSDGEETGEYIEIDLEDFDLPIKASNCETKHIENLNKLREKVEKAEKLSNEKSESDVLSKRERAILEATKEFYEADIQALDEFLGEGGTRKLLNGRKPYLTMYEDISQCLEQIIPTLKETQKNLEDRIKTKYTDKKEDNIL